MDPTVVFNPIPSALKKRLTEQFQLAQSKKIVTPESLEKDLISYLMQKDIFSARGELALNLISKLKTDLEQRGIRFNKFVKGILENAETHRYVQENLFIYLFNTGDFFKEDYAFLFRKPFALHANIFITRQPDDKLAVALAKMQLFDLKPVAKFILNGRSLERVENLLRKAYGSGELKSDRINDIFDMENLRPHSVRRKLQALLVEVFRLSLPKSKQEYSRLASLYLKGEVEPDRTKLAELLREKFTKEALELFQALAMNESDNLDIRLESISHYAKLRPDNLAETLLGIASNSQEPKVIFAALIELANAKKLDINGILEIIKRTITEDQGKAFLFTLLKLTKANFENFLRKMNSSAQDFFQKLLPAIPNLKQELSTLDADYRLNEFEGGNPFDPKESLDQESQIKANPHKTILEKVLDALQIRTLINSVLFAKSELERDNAAALLEEVPNANMVKLLQLQYCDDDREAVRLLAQALKTSAA